VEELARFSGRQDAALYGRKTVFCWLEELAIMKDKRL